MKTILILSAILGSTALGETIAPYNAADIEATTYTELPSTRPSIQLKIGPGFSTMNGMPATDGINMGSHTGLNLAAEIDLPMNEALSFNTGLNFIQKGYSASGPIDFGSEVQGTAEINGTISYLEIPALAKLNFGSQSRFSIFAGPYMAFKMGFSSGGSVTFQGQTVPINVSESELENASNDISSIDYGARAGVSAEFPLAQGLAFLIGASYDLGLKDIDKDSDSVSVKNRTLLANIGLGFKI